MLFQVQYTLILLTIQAIYKIDCYHIIATMNIAVENIRPIPKQKLD